MGQKGDRKARAAGLRFYAKAEAGADHGQSIFR